MGWLVSLVTGGVFDAAGSLLTKVMAPLLGYFTTVKNNDLSAFEAGATADSTRYVAYLDASVKMAQLQASQNSWWGARLIMMGIATLMMIHVGQVVFDSMPFFGIWFWLPFKGAFWLGFQDHVVGSWRIAALPGDMSQWEGRIILSFFIVTPAAPVLSAVSAWFHNKK